MKIKHIFLKLEELIKMCIKILMSSEIYKLKQHAMVRASQSQPRGHELQSWLGKYIVACQGGGVSGKTRCRGADKTRSLNPLVR